MYIRNELFSYLIIRFSCFDVVFTVGICGKSMAINNSARHKFEGSGKTLSIQNIRRQLLKFLSGCSLHWAIAKMRLQLLPKKGSAENHYSNTHSSVAVAAKTGGGGDHCRRKEGTQRAAMNKMKEAGAARICLNFAERAQTRNSNSCVMIPTNQLN
jgi:hypothetical protein